MEIYQFFNTRIGRCKKSSRGIAGIQSIAKILQKGGDALLLGL
jgi:hypothetical protein